MCNMTVRSGKSGYVRDCIILPYAYWRLWERKLDNMALILQVTPLLWPDDISDLRVVHADSVIPDFNHHLIVSGADELADLRMRAWT
jgi:hypothetical protein